MTLVDFEEVVNEAILTIGASGDDEHAKNFARQWVWRAKQKLAIPDQAQQVCKIFAKNLLLPKPKNFKQLDEIALYDVNDNYIPHTYHTGNSRIYPNTESFSYSVVLNEGTADEEEVTYTLPVDLSESQTSFVLGTNGTSVAYALVRYFPLPLDKNSLPQVYEHEVDAVCAFIRWKWSQRKNDNQSEIAQNRQTWKEEADWAVAKTKSMTFTGEVRKEISKILTRQIPNFNKSRF